jgi:hypothetical protein
LETASSLPRQGTFDFVAASHSRSSYCVQDDKRRAVEFSWKWQ